jgi:hypothetical protein
VNTCGEPPSERYGHTTICDTEKGKLIVFAGADGNGHFFSDTYSYSIGINR